MCFTENKISILVAVVILVLRRRRRRSRRSEDEDAGNYEVYKPPVANRTPYTQVAPYTENFEVPRGGIRRACLDHWFHANCASNGSQPFLTGPFEGTLGWLGLPRVAFPCTCPPPSQLHASLRKCWARLHVCTPCAPRIPSLTDKAQYLLICVKETPPDFAAFFLDIRLSVMPVSHGPHIFYLFHGFNCILKIVCLHTALGARFSFLKRLGSCLSALFSPVRLNRHGPLLQLSSVRSESGLPELRALAAMFRAGNSHVSVHSTAPSAASPAPRSRWDLQGAQAGHKTPAAPQQQPPPPDPVAIGVSSDGEARQAAARRNAAYAAAAHPTEPYRPDPAPAPGPPPASAAAAVPLASAAAPAAQPTQLHEPAGTAAHGPRDLQVGHGSSSAASAAASPC